MNSICERCFKHYEVRFIQPMRYTEGTLNVCPPCALKTINEVHGLRLTRFHGEYAQELYEEFLSIYGGKDGTN